MFILRLRIRLPLSSFWDGDIVGRNISFEPNKRVVQEWYFGEQEVPSIVTISIHREGGKTKVYVVHENIPADDYDEICQGWDDTYIGSIMEFFESE
jgi:activator of HSP90 ATPase